MAVRFLINGADRTSLVTRGTAEIEYGVNGRDHLRLTFDDESAALFRPAVGHVVLVYDGAAILFSGSIISLETTTIAATAGAHTEIECVDTGANAAAIGLTFATVAGETLKTCLGRLATAAGGFTVMPSQPDGPTLPALSWTSQPLSTILNGLANAVGYVYAWDAFGALLMVPSSYAPSGSAPASAPTNLAHTIVGTAGASTVTYAVAAYNEFGIGPKSADYVVNNSPGMAGWNTYTPPPPARLLTDFVSLTWDAVAGAYGYIIYGRDDTTHWIEYSNSGGINGSPNNTTYWDNDHDIETSGNPPVQGGTGAAVKYGAAPWTVTDANAAGNILGILLRQYDPSFDLTTSRLSGATTKDSIQLTTRKPGLRPGQLLTVDLTNPPIDGTFLLTTVRGKADLDNVFRWQVEGDEGGTFQGSDTDIWKQYGSAEGYTVPKPAPWLWDDDFESGAALSANYEDILDCATASGVGVSGSWGVDPSGSDPYYCSFVKTVAEQTGPGLTVELTTDHAAAAANGAGNSIFEIRGVHNGAYAVSLYHGVGAGADRSGLELYSAFADSPYLIASVTGVITPGTFQTIRMAVEWSTLTGTTPNADGRVRVWVDGVLVINAVNVVVSNYYATTYGTNSWRAVYFGPMGHGDTCRIDNTVRVP